MTIARRALIVWLTGATSLRSRAQTAKTHRIGWLTSSPLAPSPEWDAFVESMRELGWIELRHYTVENLTYGGSQERLAMQVAELVQRKVDLIVCNGSPPTAAAKTMTTTIPIVFIQAGDPVGSGFVSSLARPGSNITGLGGLGEGQHSKQLELLKQVVPKATRIAKLYNPTFAFHAAAGEEVASAARVMGLTLIPIELRSPDDIDAAFAAIGRDPVDAVHIFGQPFLMAHGARIAKLAIERRVPAIIAFQALARSGLLMSYGQRLIDDMRRAPYFIDRILKGASPAELPVEQPTRFYLTVNLRTAKVLGVTVPQSLLLRADELIN